MTASQVPIWPLFVRPSLEVLADGDTVARREMKLKAMDILGLSDEARAEKLPSGWLRAENRADWAITHVTRAGWIERVARGHYRITAAGRGWLVTHPDGLTDFGTANRTFGEFWAKDEPHLAVTVELPEAAAIVVDPLEQIEQGIGRIQADVAADLLSRLHAQAPAFFEQAVLDLLIAMGYGGAEGRAARSSSPTTAGSTGSSTRMLWA